MVRENDIYRRGVLYEKTLRGRSTVIGLHITSKKPCEAKNYKCFSAWQNALTYLLEIELGLQNNKTSLGALPRQGVW